MTARRQILLVEDSENDVALTLEALAEAEIQCPVIVVRDGREALDFLFREGMFAEEKGELPDVVFLDLKLPRVNGLEVLAQLKADGRLKRIPVVMLTSSSEDSDLIRSYDLGVNAYVVKPTSFTDFSAAIKLLGSFWAGINQPPVFGRIEEAVS